MGLSVSFAEEVGRPSFSRHGGQRPPGVVSGGIAMPHWGQIVMSFLLKGYRIFGCQALAGESACESACPTDTSAPFGAEFIVMGVTISEESLSTQQEGGETS